MPATPTQEAQAIAMLVSGSLVRAREFKDAGIPSIVLTRLYQSGQVERVSAGLYRAAGTALTEHESLLLVARKMPEAVFCLLTALQFHGLTTQLPRQVWIALPRGSHAARIPYPPVRMIQAAMPILEDGVETHLRENTALRVYSVTRTVVDCFKHRNKVGLDVALEALREALNQKKTTMDELWRQAVPLRAARVMRPYLEAVA